MNHIQAASGKSAATMAAVSRRRPCISSIALFILVSRLCRMAAMDSEEGAEAIQTTPVAAFSSDRRVSKGLKAGSMGLMLSSGAATSLLG